MVRAILEGRKTMTRRVMKPQPGPAVIYPSSSYARKCPYGQVGGRLWVREAWSGLDEFDALKPSEIPRGAPIWYCASLRIGPEFMRGMGKLRSSIFMPRWASRITLEITDIRVERLQEITLEDCWDEGVSDEPAYERPAAYSRLWDTLNGKKHPWASNPWVWVIEFKRVEKP